MRVWLGVLPRAIVFGRAFALSSLAMGSLGCSAGGAEPTTPAAARGDVVDFTFGTVDGQLIGSAALRGRVSVLLFLTTFDLVSQAQAKRLEDLSREHSPRLNALGVVLEPPRNVDLARTFQASLELHFPIAMADSETLAGRGPFGQVRGVPTWVLLDRQGRVHSAYFGAFTPSGLEDFVRSAE